MTALIYDLAFMLPLSVLGTYFGCLVSLLPMDSVAPYIAMAVVLSVCLSFKHLRDRRRFILPGMIFAVIVGILSFSGAEGREQLIEDYRWLLWLICITAACYAAGRLAVQYVIITRLLAVLILAGLLMFLFSGSFPDRRIVAVLVLLFLLCLIQETEHGWKRDGDTDRRGHLVYILPFPIFLSLLVFLAPAPDSPFGWDFAVRIWERAVHAVENVADLFQGGREDYGAQLGFSEDGGFFSSLDRENRKVLEISNGYGAEKVIYLAGKTFDHFDGKEWTTTGQESPDDRRIDTLETIAAVDERKELLASDILKRSDRSIRYLHFHTRYLFLPAKSIAEAALTSQFSLTVQDGGILAEDPLDYDDTYRISYYVLNRDHEAFRTLVREAAVPSQDAWEQTAGKESGVSYDAYLSYRERIRRTDLPDTPVSSRLEAYLGQETAGVSSDLDRLFRVEEILQHFGYTTRPGDLPQDVDSPEAFLDHFFFTSQQGYCSHFATAFVLIARHLGLPARYVQGYRVPRTGDEVLTVTSDMAHAWPEVYFDGFGWLAFEPTPGMRSQVSWMTQAEVTAGKEQTNVAADEPSDEEVILPETEEAVSKAPPVDPRIILIPAAFCVGFLILFFLADRFLSALRYRRMDDAGRFRAECRRNLKLLRILGYTPAAGETLEELRRRAEPELSEEALAFTQVMELTCYAGRTPDTAMTELAEASEKRLWEHLREKKGRRAVLIRMGMARR